MRTTILTVPLVTTFCTTACLAQSDDTYVDARFSLNGRVSVSGRNIHVFHGPILSDRAGYIMTEPNGTIIHDEKVCQDAAKVSMLFDRYRRQSELDFIRETRSRIGDFLKVIRIGKGVLLVRNAATNALVKVGILYLTGGSLETAQTTWTTMASETLKSTIKDAFTDPDTYLRYVAEDMLNQCDADLKIVEQKCGIMHRWTEGDYIALSRKEFEAFHELRVDACVLVPPRMELINALQVKGDVKSQLQTVIDKTQDELLSMIPAGGLVDDVKAADAAVKKFQSVWDNCKAYKRYREQCEKRRLQAKKEDEDREATLESDVRRGLAATTGFRFFSKDASLAHTAEPEKTALTDTIIEGRGVRGIILGISTFTDVIAEFGPQGSVNKRVLKYKHLGLSFRCRDNDERTRTVAGIYFERPYAGVTQKGVSLQGRKQFVKDVRQVYGPARWHGAAAEGDDGTWVDTGKYYIQHPGITFEVMPKPGIDMYPVDIEAHFDQSINAIAVRPVRPTDLLPDADDEIPGWSVIREGPSLRRGYGRFDLYWKVPCGSSSYMVALDGAERSVRAHVRQFKTDEDAQNLLRQYIREQRTRHAKSKSPPQELQFKERFGEDSWGTKRVSVVPERFSISAHTRRGRYCVEIRVSGMREDETSWALDRLAELCAFVDKMRQFNDAEALSSLSTIFPGYEKTFPIRKRIAIINAELAATPALPPDLSDFDKKSLRQMVDGIESGNMTVVTDNWKQLLLAEDTSRTPDRARALVKSALREAHMVELTEIQKARADVEKEHEALRSGRESTTAAFEKANRESERYVDTMARTINVLHEIQMTIFGKRRE